MKKVITKEDKKKFMESRKLKEDTEMYEKLARAQYNFK